MGKKRRTKAEILSACNQLARETRMAERTTNTSMQIICSYALWKSKNFGAKRLHDVILLVDEYENKYMEGKIDLKEMSNKLKDEYWGKSVEYIPYTEKDITVKKNSFDYLIDSKEIVLMNRINDFASRYMIFFFTALAEKHGYREGRIESVYKEMMKHLELYQYDKTTVAEWRKELMDYVGIVFENPLDPTDGTRGSFLMGVV